MEGMNLKTSLLFVLDVTEVITTDFEKIDYDIRYRADTGRIRIDE